MILRRLILLAALLATGLLGRVAQADLAGIGAPESAHRVTLQEGVQFNLITVFDRPGAQVRVWMRLPDGAMGFAGQGVVSPLGFASIMVPQAARIPGFPRYLVITTYEANDIRDWLE